MTRQTSPQDFCASARRVAVTGGAGVIGSALVDELVASGANVAVVDDLSRGRAVNLAGVSDRIDLRVGNLENAEFTERALADCDVVFHLASRAYGVAYSDGRHLQILQHNEAITHNLLTTLAAHPPQRLLVTSSSCVYPDDGDDTLAELPVFTGEPEQVNRGYGWAKRFLEQKATLFSAETNVPVVIVRPFNIYGERYRWAGNNSQAIPMLVKRVMDGEDPVVVWGSGKQRRCYIHAQDCARMMRELTNACTQSAVVNLGSEGTVSMLDLVRLICAAGGVSPELQTDPSKPEGRFTKSADMTLFRSLLPDFVQRVSMEEGIRRMIEWYRSTDFEAPIFGAEDAVGSEAAAG